MLDYVPWGYKFEKLVVSDKEYHTIYVKDDEKVIDFQQVKESNDTI